jgi:hypothetical protein
MGRVGNRQNRGLYFFILIFCYNRGMKSWGTKRRNFIILIITILVVGLSSIIFVNFLYTEPTCFDGIQNGKEEGIDCGGTCSLLCSQETFDPIVHWKRYFEVVPGIYNVMAYIENQNINAGTDILEYKFNLYDKNNVAIATRDGVVDLKPKQIVPIIETNLNTGKLRPVRVSFEIKNKIDWQKTEPQEQVINVKNERLYEIDGLPRIAALVENTSFGIVNEIKFIVIVYDFNDNAIATSRTLVESLNGGQSKNIIFTWPQRFNDSAKRFEIIPFYES